MGWGGITLPAMILLTLNQTARAGASNTEREPDQTPYLGRSRAVSHSTPSPSTDNIHLKGCNSGRPLSADDLTNSAIRRFCSRLIMRGGDQCWDWSGSKDSNGYGRIHFAPEPGQRRCELIHRIGYAIHHGPIPAGMVVMHKCDNPSCTNPKHLQLATQTENMLDRNAKGRHYRLPAMFKPEQVGHIADDYTSGMTLVELGAKYNAHFTTIRKHLKLYGVALRPKGRAKSLQAQETSQ